MPDREPRYAVHMSILVDAATMTEAEDLIAEWVENSPEGVEPTSWTTVENDYA